MEVTADRPYKRRLCSFQNGAKKVIASSLSLTFWSELLTDCDEKLGETFTCNTVTLRTKNYSRRMSCCPATKTPASVTSWNFSARDGAVWLMMARNMSRKTCEGKTSGEILLFLMQHWSVWSYPHCQSCASRIASRVSRGVYFRGIAKFWNAEFETNRTFFFYQSIFYRRWCLHLSQSGSFLSQQVEASKSIASRFIALYGALISMSAC